MSAELEAFEGWKARSDGESATRLIRSQQDRVYNICFQILRNGQDAEDAAQEILLELLKAAPRIADADHWRRCVYRIAFRSAIDRKRARTRREAHEKARAAMNPANSGSEPSEVTEAIPEAMARLDEESRDLVIAHYFEKTTLEELGKRHGCSTSAIWKRLAEARENLKRALAVAGFSTMTGKTDACLESIRPVQAPATLITSALLAKAGATTAAVAGTSAVLTLGGALIAFAVGVGGAYQLTANPPAESAPAPVVGADTAPKSAHLSVTSGGPLGTPVHERSETSTNAPLTVEATLMQRLVEFRTWIESHSPFTSRESWIELNRRTSELSDPCLKDSATYLRFIKSPESAARWNQLIRILFPEKGDEAITGRQVRFAKFPVDVVNYLADLLEQGSPQQKRDVLNLIGKFDDPGKTFHPVCGRLLQDPDPQVRRVALMRLCVGATTDLSEHFATVRQMMAQATKDYETSGCIHALTLMESAEAEDFLFGRMAENRDPELVSSYCHALQEKIRSGAPERQSQYAAAAASLLSVRLDRKKFSGVVWLYLKFRLEDATRLLEKAVSCAPDAEAAAAVTKMLDKIRDGETRIERITDGFKLE